MVHLANTAIKLTRMMRAVRLPRSTVRTPFRTTVKFADEHVLAVECFQSWAIRIRIGRNPWLRFDVPPTAVLLFMLFSFFLECFSFGRERHEARIKLYRKERSKVGNKGEDEEEKIKHQQCDRGGRLLPLLVEIIDYSTAQSLAQRFPSTWNGDPYHRDAAQPRKSRSREHRR